MALEQTIESIQGNLKDAHKLAVPGTLLHVDQLMKARQTDKELRGFWFYTADGNVYSLEGKKQTPTLQITREATNPILNNIDDAFIQLVNNHNYQVSQADFSAVNTAQDTVKIDLTKLRLQGDNSEWRYLAVGTDTPKTIGKYNAEEQKLIERVFGPTKKDYKDNMDMLRDSKIKETKIFVLNPTYVKEKAEAGPIGRASWLYNFGFNSNFGAVGRVVDFDDRLRGVRRVVAAGDALKNAVPQEINAPTFEQVWGYTSPFIGEAIKPQVEAGLRKLYLGR